MSQIRSQPQRSKTSAKETCLSENDDIEGFVIETTLLMDIIAVGGNDSLLAM